jgi:glucose/arabinose dehydrogenase
MFRFKMVVCLFSSVLSICVVSLLVRPVIAASADPACDGWTRHTRTLSSICPEIVIDGLSGQGITAIGALAFDSRGALYVSRPATGEVLRLSPDDQHAGKFLPPETIATGLNVPYGVACADVTCFVTTNTQLVRLTDKAVLVSDLTPYEVHPLHLDPQQRLWTSSAGSLIRVKRDGSDVQVSPPWKSPIADFGWTSKGSLWASDGRSHVQTESAVSAINFSPNSTPTSLTFYSNQAGSAFPQFANGLLIVTSGSWNAVTLTGHELWFVPFVEDQPGSPMALIPANIDRSNADAALYLLTFFPDHPVAVAVSPEGWIYVGLREGQIVRLRPRTV